LCSHFLVASGVFGVAVAAFLVALCPDTLCLRHQDRQMTALPVCPPDNGEVILFPKPENCSEFYQCAGGVAFTHSCPENLYYCEEKQYCTWINDPGCKFDCVITKTNHVPAVPAAVPVCPPQIGDEVTYFPNPDDCHTYYECSNEVPVLMECPDDLYYCSEKEACDWWWDPECTYNCVAVKSKRAIVEEKVVPECPPPSENGNLTLIPNPNNCSEYYLCDNGVLHIMECPGGLYFCSEKASCSWSWDPECTFNCTAVKTNPVLAEEKFDAIYERDAETTFETTPEGPTDPLPTTEGPTDWPTEGTTDWPTEGPTDWPTEGPTDWPTEGPTDWPTEGPTDWPTEGPTDWTTEGPTDWPTEGPTDWTTEGPTDATTAVPICPPQVDDEVVYLPNPDKCSAYYKCDHGVPVPMECPDGLFFCTQKNTCAWAWDPECEYNCAIGKK